MQFLGKKRDMIQKRLQPGRKGEEMGQERKPRTEGEKLLLGEMEYVIEGVEGYGGSAIVYRAIYRDRLNQDSVHKVLVKELFPYHSKGYIYRDTRGNICCRPEGKAFMERCRRSFYLGNQANLALLAQMPGQISGNLNSYEDYGTFYSVLPVHGGNNLKKLLEEGKEFQTLKEVALCIKNILRAVESFHSNGILHLDISPDNILILSSHALLIDYNSIWLMQREEGDIYHFSEKQGYTAPEVRLREVENIGPAADLYSVSAVFFKMLTGRLLLDEDLGRGMKKCLPKNLEIFKGEPVSAAYKAVQIVKKGLHILARKRYQATAEMQEELDELIRRIDGRGISYSALWEGSAREWKKQKQMDGQYLPRTIERKDGQKLSEEECRQLLLQGGNILLRGMGGMGKTQFLMRLWERGIKDFRDSFPVTIYIPLRNYQANQGETDFIRKYLLRHLCLLEQEHSMEEAWQELNRLFCNASGKQGGFLFLLDGLNEAGARNLGLLKEMEELGRKEGIGIFVTDRTDVVKKYALHQFQTAKLLPLTEKEAVEKLTEYGIPVPGRNEFLKIFENPMMLDLYRKSIQMAEENGTGGEEISYPANMDGMVGCYLENLCIQEQRKDSGNQAEQLRHSFCIKHLLPDIAGEMKRKKKTLLTMEELYILIKKNYQMMQGKSFAMAFPEYMGKTRLMLKEIANEREWFGYAVSEHLIGRLDLMEENGEGSYKLIHDNFIPYLAGLSKENRRKLYHHRIKAYGVKTGIGALAAGMIFAAGISAWKANMPPHLSEEEGGIVYSAMLRIEINTGICNTQLHGQNEVLEIAAKEGTLMGNPEDIQCLRETIEAKTAEADRAYLSYRDGSSHLKNLEDMGKYIPVDVLEDLYQKPEKLKEITEEVTERLKERLCREDSIYDTYDKRKPLVEAYLQYTEAYAMMCGAQYSQIVYSLQEMQAEQAAEEMMDAASELLVIGKYINYNSQVEISDALIKAKRHLNDAVREMERQGLL